MTLRGGGRGEEERGRVRSSSGAPGCAETQGRPPAWCPGSRTRARGQKVAGESCLEPTPSLRHRLLPLPTLPARAAEQERLLTTDQNSPLPPACTTAAQVGSRLPLRAQIHRIETRKGNSPGTKTYIKPSLQEHGGRKGCLTLSRAPAGCTRVWGGGPWEGCGGAAPRPPGPGLGAGAPGPAEQCSLFPRPRPGPGDAAVGNVAPTLQMGKPKSGRPAHFLGHILGKETRSGPGGRERARAEQGAGGRPQRPGLPESSHESVFAESFRIRPRPTLPLTPTLSETRWPHSGGAEARVS